MIFAFLLGVGDAGQFAEEARLGLDMAQGDAETVAKDRADILRLVFAHQAVVNKDAGQLRADSAVGQNGADRRVDTARHGQQRLALADGFADVADGLFDEAFHGPVLFQAAPVDQERLERGGVAGFVHHIQYRHSESGDVGCWLAFEGGRAARGAALQHDGFGRESGDAFRAGGAGQDLAVDIQGADDFCRRLAVDGSEIQDNHSVMPILHLVSVRCLGYGHAVQAVTADKINRTGRPATSTRCQNRALSARLGGVSSVFHF